MDPLLGQVYMFAGNYAPEGWAFCNGQLLGIEQYPSLFSILGTTYGGDARTTFGLPDMRGRISVHPGHAPGLSPYSRGQKGGTETVTLADTQIPSHTHSLSCNSGFGDQGNPGGHYPAESQAAGRGTTFDTPHATATPNAQMNAAVTTNTGGGQSHTNMGPFLCVNYIIALQGTYPFRS